MKLPRSTLYTQGIFALSFLLCVFVFMGFFSRLQVIESIASTFNDALTHRIDIRSAFHHDEIVIVKIDDKSLDALRGSDLRMLAFDKGAYASALETLFEKYEA